MSKSIKLEEDVYLESTSIVHNKKKLSETMNDIENLSVKGKPFMYFESIDKVREYAMSLPLYTTYIFNGSIDGNGRTFIVSKTTNLYSAILIFGYGQIVLHTLYNGVWGSREL